MSRAAALVLCATLAACGVDDAPCRSDVIEYDDNVAGRRCSSGLNLAARSAAGVIVTQAELDAALDLYDRAFATLAPMLGSPPAAVAWYASPNVITRRAEIVAAWTSDRVDTGLAALDALLHEAHIDGFTTWTAADGTLHASLWSSTHAVVSPNLAARIAALGLADVEATGELDRFTTPGNDATISTPPAGSDWTAVTFEVGWGDCFARCPTHFWRVVVTPTTAFLSGEWGPPVPDEVLAWYRDPARLD